MHTKQSIIELLKNSDKAIARALVVLNSRQTEDEQASEATFYSNGRGFNGCDARIGTSMANFYQSKGYLTTAQLNYWRKENSKGVPRIAKYAGQLLEEAKEKENRKIAEKQKSMPKSVTGDYGNDMERKMILEEMLGDVIDSDTPEIIDPIQNEINEINAYWAALTTQV